MIFSPYSDNIVDISDLNKLGEMKLKDVLPDSNTWIPAYLQFGKPVLHMPKGPEMFVTILFGIGSLAVLCYAIYLWRKTKQSWPLWLFVGGIPCTFYEFFDSQTLHFMYPQVNDIHVATIWGFSIPLFLVLIYPFYVSFLVILGFSFCEFRKMSGKVLWIIYGCAFLGAMCFEPPALHYGLWYYQGQNQPFKIFDFPYFWFICNPAMIVCVGPTVHYIWNTLLKRRHIWSVLFMIPYWLFAYHLAMTVPEMFAINTCPGTTMTNIMAVFSSLLGLGTVYVLGVFEDHINVLRDGPAKPASVTGAKNLVASRA
jgi:hypothetical protein